MRRFPAALCSRHGPAARGFLSRFPEGPAGGNTRANLAKIGITFGDNFISPTGALFSTKLQIVGRREPMYDSQREVEEAIYDHFAESLKTKTTQWSTPDLFQSMRQKVAEAAKTNPLLAKAIADAANVDKDLDLVSAAKTQAVVEKLDEIAYGNSGEYLMARQAIISGPNPPPIQGQTAEQTAQLAAASGAVFQPGRILGQGKADPRNLRLAVVKYYIQADRLSSTLDSSAVSQADDNRSEPAGQTNAAIHLPSVCLLQSARFGERTEVLRSGWQRSAA